MFRNLLLIFTWIDPRDLHKAHVNKPIAKSQVYLGVIHKAFLPGFDFLMIT